MIKIPSHIRDPILIASIDGVGSKSSYLTKNINENKAYEIVGKDIVAHSINDILVKGATPLFMLDYVASSKLNKENIIHIIKGMSSYCAKYNCPIIGGETAEMPNIYHNNEIDIVGSIVGVSERNKIINGKQQIELGDLAIGLPSNGLHTNGFSLIRKLAAKHHFSNEFIEWVSQPHTCYFDQLKFYKKIISIYMD